MKTPFGNLEIRFKKDADGAQQGIDRLNEKIAGLGRRIEKLEAEPTGIQCIEGLHVAMKRRLDEPGEVVDQLFPYSSPSPQQLAQGLFDIYSPVKSKKRGKP